MSTHNNQPRLPRGRTEYTTQPEPTMALRITPELARHLDALNAAIDAPAPSDGAALTAHLQRQEHSARMVAILVAGQYYWQRDALSTQRGRQQ